uniref:Serine/arginine repetitive matrix protein 2 n=1 Tax=Cacopsylla melanoneura TaxID=428564 RepID=A0A8D9EK96_9HEMI
MYNGIGLETARGSGTNGYVQRNWSLVRKTKDKTNLKTEKDLERMDAMNNKQPNREILDHEKKRKIEIQCLELQELLEEQGFSEIEVDAKVMAYRLHLNKNVEKINEPPLDELGRVIVRETHHIAEAQLEKNAKLRDAFGISEYFVEGSSLDPARREKEAQARSAAAAIKAALEPVEKKKYALVRTPSPETGRGGGKTKKRKRRDSSSGDDHAENKKSKKKKSKKAKQKSRNSF